MASKNLLTEQDKIAYSVISKFIKENGYPPSVRELCKIMGKSSTATIKYRLKSLEQKGFIKTTSGAKRTIRLLNEVEQGRCDWCKTYEGGMGMETKKQLYNAHEVAEIIAELFGDSCACNFNRIDEWLPFKCELQDACPNPAGVACWEQYLKHRDAKMDGDGNG